MDHGSTDYGSMDHMIYTFDCMMVLLDHAIVSRHKCLDMTLMHSYYLIFTHAVVANWQKLVLNHYG